MEEKEIKEKVLQALTELGKGAAVDVVKKIQDLNPELPNKEVIGGTHNILADLYAEGQIAGTDSDGTIIYTLK